MNSHINTPDLVEIEARARQLRADMLVALSRRATAWLRKQLGTGVAASGQAA